MKDNLQVSLYHESYTQGNNPDINVLIVALIYISIVSFMYYRLWSSKMSDCLIFLHYTCITLQIYSFYSWIQNLFKKGLVLFNMIFFFRNLACLLKCYVFSQSEKNALFLALNHNCLSIIKITASEPQQKNYFELNTSLDRFSPKIHYIQIFNQWDILKTSMLCHLAPLL